MINRGALLTPKEKFEKVLKERLEPKKQVPTKQTKQIPALLRKLKND